MTDIDFAENFTHTTLDNVDLTTATTQTYEKSYVEDTAKAGETLGSSTDDLTAAATGSGEAETVTEAPRAGTGPPRRNRLLLRSRPPAEESAPAPEQAPDQQENPENAEGSQG